MTHSCEKCNKSIAHCKCKSKKTSKPKRTRLIPKFFIGDTVFFMRNNKVCSSKVIGIRTTELCKDESYTVKQNEVGWHVQKIEYLTLHGKYNEREVFASKSALLKSL